MKNSKKIIAASLVAILCICGVGAFAFCEDESSAATPDRTTAISVTPGMSYTYTPSFPSDLNVTVTIESQTSTWASLSGKTLTVNFPSTASSGSYSVMLKYSTTNPTQVYYDLIDFTICSNLIISGSQPDIVLGESVDMTPAASGLGTVTWAVKEGTNLPAGLALSSTSTGRVTGTPTSAGTNIIQLTATTSYGETADLTVSFQVYPAIGTITGDSEIYAIAGVSKASAVFSCENATGWSLDVSNAPAGATVTWNDASRTITVSSASPQSSFTVTLKATSSGGQEVTKTITITVCNVLAPLNDPSNGAIAYVV